MCVYPHAFIQLHFSHCVFQKICLKEKRNHKPLFFPLLKTNVFKYVVELLIKSAPTLDFSKDFYLAYFLAMGWNPAITRGFSSCRDGGDNVLEAAFVTNYQCSPPIKTSTCPLCDLRRLCWIARIGFKLGWLWTAVVVTNELSLANICY